MFHSHGEHPDLPSDATRRSPELTRREQLDDRAPLPGCERVIVTGDRGLWGAWVRLQTALDPRGLFESLVSQLTAKEQAR